MSERVSGRVVSLDGYFYLKKPHFCPKCKTQLEPITVTKTLRTSSPEAKDFNFSSAGGNMHLGKYAKYSWKELKCPACNHQLRIEEMKRIEFEQMDAEQLKKYEKRRKLSVFLFISGMVAFVLMLLALPFIC